MCKGHAAMVARAAAWSAAQRAGQAEAGCLRVGTLVMQQISPWCFQQDDSTMHDKSRNSQPTARAAAAAAAAAQGGRTRGSRPLPWDELRASSFCRISCDLFLPAPLAS